MDLICGICKWQYNNNKNKPILLTCGHTLCSACINFYKEAGKEEIECPKCYSNCKSTNIICKNLQKPKIESSSSIDDNEFEIFIRTRGGETIILKVNKTMTISQLKNKIFEEYGYNKEKYTINFKKPLNDISKTLEFYGIRKSVTLSMTYPPTGGGPSYSKEINIKFIRNQNNKNISFESIFPKGEELYGLLKLYLLKEIASKYNDENIEQLPDLLSYIIQILKNGYIADSIPKEDIKKILEKMEGSHILNFSKYIDKAIDSNQIKILLQYLNNADLISINDIRKRLLNYNEYMKLFEKDFEIRKKNSIFEFAIISLVVAEREDLQIFEKERKNCPNRVDKILYHGTQIQIVKEDGKIIDPIPSILTGFFHKSRCIQHGQGIYFTDVLDNCWFYGGKDNRCNGDVIPNINATFTFIACFTYYDKMGFRKVYDWKYTPKKNEINFAYADNAFDTIHGELDKTKFYGTEYVIWESTQICPFIAAKLKRKEYCVIWRDNNFSSKPVYNNEFDEIFKKFLTERMNYIEQYAELNIYPCETTKEAIDLIKRKKYNKIILISNVGTDLGGKAFIDEARQILNNDVLVLFLAYNIAHLDWIKNYKNALFSNESSFYEEYLKCFSEKNLDKENEILNLKSKMESHYKIKFNFDDKFLDFPYYKSEGSYGDLRF